MDAMQTFIGVIFIALILIGVGIGASIASQETAVKYSNVTDTLESGTINTTLATDNASIDGAYYSDTATVVNESSGNTLNDPADYEWNSNNGTLRITSQNAANTTLEVSYDWWERSETQIALTESTSWLLEAGAWIPFLLVVALIMLILSMMGALS